VEEIKEKARNNGYDRMEAVHKREREAKEKQDEQEARERRLQKEREQKEIELKREENRKQEIRKREELEARIEKKRELKQQLMKKQHLSTFTGVKNLVRIANGQGKNMCQCDRMVIMQYSDSCILSCSAPLSAPPIISTSEPPKLSSTSKKTGSAREQRMDPVELELVRKKERERKANQRRHRSPEVKEAQNAKEAERQKGYRLKRKLAGLKEPQYKKVGNWEEDIKWKKQAAERMRIWRAKTYGPPEKNKIPHRKCPLHQTVWYNPNNPCKACLDLTYPKEIREFWSKCSEEELEKMRQKKKQDNDRAARHRKINRYWDKKNGIKRKDGRKSQRRRYR